MHILFSFLPVILLLVLLVLLDHFRLVSIKLILTSLLWGAACALACSYLNTLIAGWLDLDFIILSRYIAPVTEETTKAAIILFLVSRKRIGFIVDAAVYGFAVGTGFSLVENLALLIDGQQDLHLAVWIIRGFGTAVMHGGCTAVLAMVITGAINRSGNLVLSFLPGWLSAIVLHSAFNHFPVNPLWQTLIVMTVLPFLLVVAFRISNERLKQWLEIEFSSEVELLGMIRKGELRLTKAGSFLLSVRERFDPETVVDLYCYMALYLELSIRAKRNLMLKENGLPVMVESDLESKLIELAQVRKKIGPLGEYVLSPLIRMNYRNLWKIRQLGAEGKKM